MLFIAQKRTQRGQGRLRLRPCTSSRGPSGTRPQSVHPTCMRMLWSCSPSTWNPAARSAWLAGCKVQLAFAVFSAVGAQAVQMVPEVLLTVISASLKLREARLCRYAKLRASKVVLQRVPESHHA